jgi:hypothetical protein
VHSWIIGRPDGRQRNLIASNGGRFRTGQPGRHPHSDRGLDFYPTPPVAAESLIEAEPEFFGYTSVKVWDPWAGNGGIVRVLRDRGLPVVASDIEQRSLDLDLVEGLDNAELVINLLLEIAPAPSDPEARALFDHADDTRAVIRIAANLIHDLRRDAHADAAGLASLRGGRP